MSTFATTTGANASAISRTYGCIAVVSLVLSCISCFVISSFFWMFLIVVIPYGRSLDDWGIDRLTSGESMFGSHERGRSDGPTIGQSDCQADGRVASREEGRSDHRVMTRMMQ